MVTFGAEQWTEEKVDLLEMNGTAIALNLFHSLCCLGTCESLCLRVVS